MRGIDCEQRCLLVDKVTDKRSVARRHDFGSFICSDEEVIEIHFVANVLLRLADDSFAGFSALYRPQELCLGPFRRCKEGHYSKDDAYCSKISPFHGDAILL